MPQLMRFFFMDMGESAYNALKVKRSDCVFILQLLLSKGETLFCHIEKK